MIVSGSPKKINNRLIKIPHRCILFDVPVSTALDNLAVCFPAGATVRLA
jgi:hypothetical protein